MGLALAASGCGSAHQQGTGRALDVTERDFRITAPATVAAGTVWLHVHNRGPDTHELLVVRAPARGRVPLRADGLTVDEERLDAATAGHLDGIPAGHDAGTALHLSPGRYVLFCNMAGHYLGGMRRTLVVR